MATLRAITTDEWPRITKIFWDTFVLGSPLPFNFGHPSAYEDLVLGWYRHNPEDSRVVATGDTIVGYVLVCTDQQRFEKEQPKAALRYLRRTVLCRSASSPQERRFLFYRLIDGYEAWRDEDPKAVGAHAHFNVARGNRSGLLVRDLVEHIDEVCQRAGLTHWTGQINGRAGQRIGLLRRYGFHVDSRAKNRTLSWLTGSSVERLTVVREVGALQRLDVAS